MSDRCCICGCSEGTQYMKFEDQTCHFCELCMRALVIGIQLEREFPGVLDIEIEGETRHKKEVRA